MFRDLKHLLVPSCHEFMQYISHQVHQCLSWDTEHCHRINSVSACVRSSYVKSLRVPHPYQLHLCYLYHEDAGHRYCCSKPEVILLNILKVKNFLLFQLPPSKTSRHIVH